MKQTVNDRVRQLRIAAGKSQAEFANDVDVSHSLLSKIEVGAKDINPKLIDKISTVYKIEPANWLIDGKGELKFTRPSSTVKFDPATDTLYKELRERITRQDTIIDRLTQALIGKGNFRLALNGTGLPKRRSLGAAA